MRFDALINEGEYFPPYYLDEMLPKQLKAGLLKQWAASERQGATTPRQGLRDLTAPYLDARLHLGGLAEKFNEVSDSLAVAGRQAAADILRTTPPGEEPPAFLPAAPGLPPYDDTDEGVWRTGLADWHASLLRALGFEPTPGHLTAHGAAGPVAVPVAHHEPGLVVLTGGFTQEPGETRGDTPANRLPAPVRIAPGKQLTTVTDLAAWLLTADENLRYAILLFGGVMVLADRDNFSRGRHLTVDLDTALPRKSAKAATAGELDIIAALFGAPALRPREDGSDDEIARLVAESRDHSVGVTDDLRHGLRESVQLIAGEVLELARTREQGAVHPEDFPEWLPDTLRKPDDLPKRLTDEALRYLYRIVFLLYAEARPDLDVLPMKSQEYAAGYSVARLRELCVQEKLPSTSHKGHHFHESLALLFDKVFHGHPAADIATSRDDLPDRSAATVPVTAPSPTGDRTLPLTPDDPPPLTADDGNADVRIEALRSRLFDPKGIKLVGRLVPAPAHLTGPGGTPAADLDLRLRNKVLHQVLRNLTVVEGKGRGGRGGFISYANLSINHLGAVYEGLMSYTGFIATEPLYEVAKGADPKGGSWLITGDQVQSGRYPDRGDENVFVDTDVHPETGLPMPRPHEVGTFVYRLAGRDRQTSASYYTPASLTEATVEQTLRFRLDDKGAIDPRTPEAADVTAAEVLRWRVCEPALGSGAFLNEAVNQLAELYLRLAKRDTGREIDPEEYGRELQKVKAYIALHNAYGVDLNHTAVELAEVSLWLNSMYRGMKAPWYGLHLHRGNSLVGAARKVYPGLNLSKGRWLTAKDSELPRHVPLGRQLPGRAVHQFLLPARGWGSIGEKIGLRKPRKGAADQTVRAVVDGDVVDWLEPSVVEQLAKWRSAMRRKPRGSQKTTTGPVSGAKPRKAAAPVVAPPVEELQPGEQGMLDLAFLGQLTLGASAAETPARATARAVPAAGEAEEEIGGRTQTGRLMALARRVEFLWDLVKRRLELSEQEIARDLDVWGLEPDDREGERAGRPMDRDAVLAALLEPGRPYWRLKQVMDAWCALWFWPLEEIGLLDGTDRDAYFDGDLDLTTLKRGQASSHERKVALKSLDDWIEFAESVVGRVDVVSEEGRTGLLVEFSGVSSLDGLDAKERELDDVMRDQSAWEEPADLGDVFPWYETVQRIAEDRGFFHWELDYAHVFAAGGFDLMVGNPPWVRQEWEEDTVLAEIDPWFVLGGQAAEEGRAENVASLLSAAKNRSFYLGELETVAGVSEFLSSPDTYPELVGTRPDMYRAFMLLAWRATGERGTAGIIHPSTHLTGGNEGVLRRAAYGHLRLHADFVNQLYLFAKPVGHASHFSVNVYGRTGPIRFQHLSWLVHPSVLTGSVRGVSIGENPGLKHEGAWDVRPHEDRVVTVTHSVLAEWRKLAGEGNPPPVEETKLLFPVSVAEESAIKALAKWPHRLGALEPRISSGFNEKTDRTAGYFTWDSGPAESWEDVILQGPFIGVATPFFKRPVDGARTSLQVEMWNAEGLAEDQVPYTNYRRSVERSLYVEAHDRWVDSERFEQLISTPAAVAAAKTDVVEAQPDLNEQEQEEAAFALLNAASLRPYSELYRVAWREMIASDTERSLYACVIPPGAAHVHAMRSAAIAPAEQNVLVAGFFASLALDYVLRASGRGHLDTADAQALPAPTRDHPLATSLIMRTLRLNCQTTIYAALWEQLYDPTWKSEAWAGSGHWPDSHLSLSDGVGPTWTADTPLRTEFARRAALVEIDALVAVWLGISADELIAMYNARFPVLQQYEENMWFDATGRRIAKAHQQHGYGQPKDAWKRLSSHEDFPEEANVPDGYTGPLYRANRRREMRAAHKEFTRRLLAAGWEPGDTTGPAVDGA
ncbi:Eco57I restriction-modification methylase domain-containing protein [Streptomyces sp. NPDC003023]|uniref:Eco57I restriction-modification methylase domain-containing protein n=1 Tax=Streptomyces sp. NPDC003023 TaxID=3364675 RepID=UPI0036C516C4